MRVSRWVAGVAAVLVVSVTVLVSVAVAAEIDLFARLSGSSAYPRVTGHSEYERGNGREVEVTIGNAGRLAGKRLNVFVAGQKIGSMLVSSGGTAHIDRDTEHGQFVPVASAGDTVRVRRADGTLVAGGKYVRVAGD